MVINIRILVETSDPIPSEKEILDLVYKSLNSRFTTKQIGRAEKLVEPISFRDVSVESRSFCEFFVLNILFKSKNLFAYGTTSINKYIFSY